MVILWFYWRIKTDDPYFQCFPLRTICPTLILYGMMMLCQSWEKWAQPLGSIRTWQRIALGSACAFSLLWNTETGMIITLCGVIFIGLCGWLMIPQLHQKNPLPPFQKTIDFFKAFIPPIIHFLLGLIGGGFIILWLLYQNRVFDIDLGLLTTMLLMFGKLGLLMIQMDNIHLWIFLS